MRRLFLGLLVLSFLALPCAAISSSSKKDEVKYEVKISIIYNEVSAVKAGRLVRDITEEHSKACKVEVKTKKIDARYGVITGVTWSDSSE